MVSGRKNTVLFQENNEKKCAYCGKNLQVVEGVTLYDRNWFHYACWDFFEKQEVIQRYD